MSVISAGTGSLVGYPIQPDAARLLSQVGALTDDFAAQDLTGGLIESADLVLAMTRAHRSGVAREAPRALPRLFTLREFVRLATLAAKAGWREQGDPVTRLKSLVPAARDQRGMAFATEVDDDVPDPYGG